MNERVIAQAKGKYTLAELIDMRHDVVNMHVIDVGYQRIPERLMDLRVYFRDREVEVSRIGPRDIQIGEVRIHVVSMMRDGWEERVAGFKDFVWPDNLKNSGE